MAREADFQPLPLSLIGPLDTRSRPADLLPGWHRFKLNMAINRDGHLARRTGFDSLSFGQRTDDVSGVNNWDFHRQDAARNPVTLLYDSAGPDGVHRLFNATKERISWLDNDTSQWTTIKTGLSNGRVRAATLKDKVVFVNNVDDVFQHTLGSGTVSTVPTLTGLNGPSGESGLNVESAKIVLQFQGVIVLMNTVESGTRRGVRIRWSNKDVVDFDPSFGDPITGVQDLSQTDSEILNAIIFNSQVYIFTATGIYRMFVKVSADSIFGFAPVYIDTEGKAGCLAYENTLCTDGERMYWFGRDSIYSLDKYGSAPVAEEWLLKSSGRVFNGDSQGNGGIDTTCCQSAIGKYNTNTKELWFSYARRTATKDADGNCLNDYSIVLHRNDDLSIPIRTADYVDAGFTALGNFSRTAQSGEDCNTASVFIGALGEDYCLKSIGGVFFRTIVTGPTATVEDDIADDSMTIIHRGYQARDVAQIPTGYPSLEKICRSVVLQHDTVEQDIPNILRLRIGVSCNLADPMDLRPRCSVQWTSIGDEALTCPEEQTIAELTAAGLKPSMTTGWNPYYQGNFLYYDLTVLAPDGSAPVGSDSAWLNLNFEVMPIQ